MSVSEAALPRSLYLLPPRPARLVVVAASGPRAALVAAFLRERGWGRVAWLDAPATDLPSNCLVCGPEPNRAWEPSPFLGRVLPLLPRAGAAPACDLACGSGRNAVYAALAGWTVLGVDRLADALAQARRLAREAGVPRGRASFRQVDLEDPEAARRLLRPGRFGLLLCFRYLDRRLLPLLPRALAPGGALVYETFLEAQARENRRPRNPAHLLRPRELREAFPGLSVLRYREGKTRDGDWLASLAVVRPLTAG